MNRLGEMNTAGDRWVSVPNTGGPSHTGSLNGVWVPRGMRVNWTYTHGVGGSYINGYTLEPVIPETKEEVDEKDNS